MRPTIPVTASQAGPSAKALLLTMLGEFALPHGGSIWTSTIIEGLGLLGIDERNGRQAVARLADSGVVRSERDGRRTRWHLTESGHHLLATGAKRIYGFGAEDDDWDGRWLVVSCSVPENDRHKRHRLRTRLEFLGFGFVGASLAISPHTDRETQVSQVLGELELLPGALVFRGEAGQAMPDHQLLGRAWDLDALANEYLGFIERFETPVPTDQPAAVAALIELVHAWRRFPFIDPEIPRPLLPADWPGHRGIACFQRQHNAWSTTSVNWFLDREALA